MQVKNRFASAAAGVLGTVGVRARGELGGGNGRNGAFMLRTHTPVETTLLLIGVVAMPRHL